MEWVVEEEVETTEAFETDGFSDVRAASLDPPEKDDDDSDESRDLSS